MYAYESNEYLCLGKLLSLLMYSYIDGNVLIEDYEL